MNIETFIAIIKGDTNFLVYPYYGPRPAGDVMLPFFLADNKGYSLGEIQYGSNQPDISFHVRLDGDVLLDSSLELKKISTSRFYLYKMFEAGKPKKNELICSMSPITRQNLIDGGVRINSIDDSNFNTTIYEINLSDVKFDNYLSEKYSADTLCSKMITELKWKARMKVVNYFIDQLSDDKAKTERFSNTELLKKYDEATVAMLNENFVDDSGYNPKYTHDSSKPLFEVKISGFSNLPKVEDIVKRIADGKKQTTAGEFMVEPVNDFIKLDKEELLKEKIKVEELLDGIQQKIRNIKYGIFLSNNWFEEFTEKGDNSLKIDEIECNIIYNGKGNN